jgi:hypothetical protein
MKDITTKNWGKAQINIKGYGNSLLESKPEEFHLKEDGAKDGSPSLAIVMTGPVVDVVGQISIKMLAEALNELGYKLEKKYVEKGTDLFGL